MKCKQTVYNPNKVATMRLCNTLTFSGEIPQYLKEHACGM